MGLTSAEIQAFQKEGYLIFPGLIRGEKLAHYKQVLDTLVERTRSLSESQDGFNLQPDHEGNPILGRLFKVQGVCVVEPRLLALAREPQIIARVASLIGPQLHMFGSKFFPMLPRGGTSTGWHQDNHYFGTVSDRVVSCGIYLEESDESNGCLRLIPRSHLAGQIMEHNSGQGTFAHGAWAQVDESQVLSVECPGGTVVLFSANLLHGATTNSSHRSRYSTAWHYIPADLELEMFPFGQYADRHAM
ncbi:phytanoyl-CoA dioxygenase family protein [Chloroflexi bacterium TSY]|nr:phytanoyl-CoA dioxygenase family protein [Chloroflexi bacterium TSY]